MMKRLNTPAVLLALAAALAVLFGAACASADDGVETASDSEPAASPAAASPQVADPTATTPPPAPPSSRDDHELIGSAAPPIVGPTGWINTDPVTIEGLQGKVVLVDFWTYTCVNCIRTLPYLKEWHERYASQGLVILGVHAPEFEFEKDLGNVREAVARHDLQYPIVQDNEMATWRAYRNRFWPAKYLIDHTGVVRYAHFGEGAYEETEQVIRDLLGEAGVSVRPISMNPDAEGLPAQPRLDPRAFESTATRQTRELYAGYLRNLTPQGRYIGNSAYYAIPTPDTPTEFTDPRSHQNHFLYLQGTWTNGPESVTHGRATAGFEDYIALKFYGRSANVVIDFDDEAEPYAVVITIDDQPLPESLWGDDIELDAEDRTVVTVDTARMYRLVQSGEYAGRELKLSANSDRFSVFAFTFGSYDSGP